MMYLCVFFFMLSILCFCLFQALSPCQMNTVSSFSWHIPSALCLQQTVRSFTQQAHTTSTDPDLLQLFPGICVLVGNNLNTSSLCNGLILSDGQWAIVCTSKSYGCQHNYHLPAAGSDAVANCLTSPSISINASIFFFSRIFHFPILEECSLHLVGLFTIDLQMKQIVAALDSINRHCLYLLSFYKFK